MGRMFCNLFWVLEHFLHFLVMCVSAGRCQGLCVLLSWDVPEGETSPCKGWMEVGGMCMLLRETCDAQALTSSSFMG